MSLSQTRLISPSRVIEGLAPEVRDHEPRIALDGSDDGLTFYRILAEEARNHLAEGGSIYMEIGYDQSEAVEGLFRSGGYRDVEDISVIWRDRTGW